MKMMKILRVIAALLVCFTMCFSVCACNEGNDPPNNDIGDSEEGGNEGGNGGGNEGGSEGGNEDDEDGEGTGERLEGDALYTALFSTDSKVTVKIDMAHSEWKKLNNDYYEWRERVANSPIYRMANVTVTVNGVDYVYEETGIRMKGNTSRTDFYNDDGFYNNVHFKLSFQETFDDETDYKADERKVWADKSARDERKDRTFATLEKLDLKWNSVSDASYVREMYANKLFRENGVPTSNVSLCSVVAKEKDANYKKLGIYKLYEPIDKVFLKRNFPEDSGGDLYKCTYNSRGSASLTSADSIGVEDEWKDEIYTYDLKTNKKTSDNSRLRGLITALNGNGASAKTVSEYFDVEYFANFEALNYIIGNPDCIRNNYNNYYIYIRPSDQKAVIIPFDYDRCLGITYQWNPSGDGMKTARPFTRMALGANQSNINPLYKLTVQKGADTGSDSALQKYRTKLLEYAEMDFVGGFNALFNAMKKQYSSDTVYVGKSDIAFSSTKDANNLTFSDYMTNKIATLKNNINDYNA